MTYLGQIVTEEEGECKMTSDNKLIQKVNIQFVLPPYDWWLEGGLGWIRHKEAVGGNRYSDMGNDFFKRGLSGASCRQITTPLSKVWIICTTNRVDWVGRTREGWKVWFAPFLIVYTLLDMSLTLLLLSFINGEICYFWRDNCSVLYYLHRLYHLQNSLITGNV